MPVSVHMSVLDFGEVHSEIDSRAGQGRSEEVKTFLSSIVIVRETKRIVNCECEEEKHKNWNGKKSRDGTRRDTRNSRIEKKYKIRLQQQIICIWNQKPQKIKLKISSFFHSQQEILSFSSIFDSTSTSYDCTATSSWFDVIRCLCFVFHRWLNRLAGWCIMVLVGFVLSWFAHLHWIPLPPEHQQHPRIITLEWWSWPKAIACCFPDTGWWRDGALRCLISSVVNSTLIIPRPPFNCSSIAIWFKMEVIAISQSVNEQ